MSPLYCVKSVRIWSFSGPYSVQMRESRDQKNSEYGHFQAVLGNVYYARHLGRHVQSELFIAKQFSIFKIILR